MEMGGGVREIKEERPSKRKRERMRERDEELNVEEENKKAGLRWWETHFSGSHLSSFDQECLHPREVLVFVTVMPIRPFRQ